MGMKGFRRGKPLMQRSKHASRVKKKAKTEITAEERDRLYYLGLNLQ